MKQDSPAAKKSAGRHTGRIKLKLQSTPQVFFEGKNIPQSFKGEFFIDALEELIRSNHPDKKDFQLRRR